MQGCVQHDDGEAQHVAGVGVREDVRVELAVALGEAFHHAIDLLRLAWQPKTPQKLPATTQTSRAVIKILDKSRNISGHT